MTIEQIKNAYTKKGYKFYGGDGKPFNANVFGIRNNDCNVDNMFDDKIGIIYTDDLGKEQLFITNGTTQPGKYYMQHPINQKGSAIIVPGQYKKSHIIGLHFGYPALVQAGTLKVYRDKDLDLVYNYDDKTICDSNGDGINIHHAGSDSKFVDNFSAGCQVISNLSKWYEFFGIVSHSRELYGNSFTYTLFLLKDIE